MSQTATRDRLLEIADALVGLRIAVVGDLLLDRYWVGRSSRISREAPVLILDFEEERALPGGAANAALNVQALGGTVRLVGRIGTDAAGNALRGSLRARGLERRWLHRDRACGTVVKTRVLAGSSHASRQQIVRLDRGHAVRPAAISERSLAAAAGRAIRGADGVLLSDYGYGVLGPHVREAALREARRRRTPVVVDSRYALGSYRGASLLTPNEHEVKDALGLPSLELGVLRRAGERLRRGVRAQGVWITRGSDGMLLFERGARPRRLSIVGSSDVTDVTGAGDAVSAAAVLALAAGATHFEAAMLATFAASVVVMKRGTATVDRRELRSALRAHDLPTARA